jgi:hypothetical protein
MLTEKRGKVFPSRNFAPGGVEKLVNVFGEMAQK